MDFDGHDSFPYPRAATAARRSASPQRADGSSNANDAVAAAAALGVGPGLEQAPTAASVQRRGPLSGRILLQQSVPLQHYHRHKASEESKEQQSQRARRSAGGAGGRGSDGSDGGDGMSLGAEAAQQSKLPQLHLPMLRAVYQTASPAALGAAAINASNSDLADVASSPTAAPSTTIIGGLDADYENYERSLGLRTGEDAIEFFARTGGNSNTPVKFVYALRRQPTDSRESFRPYDLIVVPRKRIINHSGTAQIEHFTISSAGVVHIHPPPAPSEFISLAQWMHESSMFNVLRAIRFFKHYLPAKMFRLWRSNVRYRIYCQQRAALSKKLFLARESFAAPLLEVNRIMHDFDGIALTNVKSGVYLAEQFVKDQSEARASAAKKFEERFERLADTVEKVCKGVKDRARQYDHRIANDDLSNSRFAQHLLGGNGRIKSMVAVKQERADRLKQLKHANLEADMLGDFIRLVDYIQVEHLVHRAIASAVQLLFMLLNSNKALFQTTVAFAKEWQGRSSLAQTITAAVGSNALLSSAASSAQHGPYSSAIGSYAFSGHASSGSGGGSGANPNGLAFSPTAKDFHNIIHAMMESCISTVDTVDRILSHPKFKPFVSPLLTDSPKIARLIHSSRAYLLARRSIQEKIDTDFATIEATIAFLERHRPVYEFGERWRVDSYRARSDHTVESLQRDMLQQTDWNLNIRKVRDLYDAGIFEANTKELKMRLTPITEDALRGMKALLTDMFASSCKELQDIYAARMKALDEEAGTLPLFAAHVETFTALKAEAKQLYERSRKIEAMHSLMLHYEVPILPQDEVAFDDLLGAVKQFDSALLAAEARIEERMPTMKQHVYKNIARLDASLEQQRLLLDEGVFVDEKAHPRDVLKELDRVKATLAEIQNQTATLQAYQVLFEKNEPYAFASLPLTLEAYERKRSFWELYAAWLDKTKRWNNDDFLSIDVEAMDRDVSDTYATIVKMNKQFRDAGAAVTAKVKTMIAEFKSIMPMLLELGNKSVKTQHWRAIFTALGSSYFPQQDKIRLKHLRKMNVFAHRALISDITEQAVGEDDLVKKLSKIQKVWAAQEFTLQTYQKSKDIFVLGDIDDTLTKLEEHQSLLQTMLASPFIAAVQADVELWDKKLSLLAEVLDEWLQCQRNFCYLQPIFSSGDIQRQLPLEAKMFAEVDRFWREQLRRTAAHLNVLASTTTNPAILAQFIKANRELERIQKHLEEYLETKRMAFPRFFFVSNNELIAVLSQTRDPQAVQPHLNKCFDNIARLQFTDAPNSVEVTAMVSQEAEVVPFAASVFAKGNTESWLQDVEDMMRTTVRALIYRCLRNYPQADEKGKTDRTQWLQSWPSQPLLVVDQIKWTYGVEHALRRVQAGEHHALAQFLQRSKAQIADMVSLVRGPLDKQTRQMMSSLIILDVHARDVVEKMVADNISNPYDFSWQKQIRHSWENVNVDDTNAQAPSADSANASAVDVAGVPDGEDCVVRQTNAAFIYAKEYLGNATRLVITPLTDRCYITLTQALHLHYGGAPAGPAGTGKTETVKDLAKVLAVQCVVFNCSEGLTSRLMAQYFSGLAQAGAWACFDEFNRIDIEVLSVIAQQILTIQSAVAAGKVEFEFEGRVLPLNSQFGCHITMNPGYAGRTELPDNLKALFRPVAMMVPDYALIAQIILFSEGFQTATTLSKKMTQLYKLASEQLSQQQHYDFGMRAVKAVLVAAGQLKRAATASDSGDNGSGSASSSSSEEEETLLLISAMRSSNIPKFLAQDLPLFESIITDLFPHVSIAPTQQGALQQAIEQRLRERKLQPVPSFVEKILQLHETMLVRHGVMTVGAAGTGKSIAAQVLAEALTSLRSHPSAANNAMWREIHVDSLNPKAVSMALLYGAQNAVGEWTDGLVPFLSRKAVANASASTREWLLFDGPVDALWIENLNTVLDDNKLLCLANGERIKLKQSMTFMFEVEDLKVASPATVSRCGMVLFEEATVGWRAVIECWRPELEAILPERAEFIVSLLLQYVPALLQFVSEECVQLIPTVESNLVRSCCSLFAALVKQVKQASESDIEGGIADEDLHLVMNQQLFTALVWSFGANLHDASRASFNNFLRGQLQVQLAPSLPLDGDVYDYVFDVPSMRWASWSTRVPAFVYDANQPFFSIVVPTSETVKNQYLLDALISVGERNVLLQGETGTSKTTLVADFLRAAAVEKKALVGSSSSSSSAAASSSSSAATSGSSTAATATAYVPVSLTFSAQTSAGNVQDILETKLEKKRKNLYGAPVGKKVVVFVDDINLPSREVYGASPPLELLRQALEGGFYNRQKLFFTRIQDVLYVAACAPPGGGRSAMTQRLTRHFHHIWQPLLSDASLKHIFSSILGGWLGVSAAHWAGVSLDKIAASLVATSVDMYTSLRKHMLPTPSKSHYTYNLRDLSKVFSGLCSVSSKVLVDPSSLLRLWIHESSRVFRDRLVDDNDRAFFNRLCSKALSAHFDAGWRVEDDASLREMIFTDLVDSSSSEREYREIDSVERLNAILQEQSAEFNLVFSQQMHLVFFNSAIQHLCRIARILRQPRGNALLIGVGGSGRQSLTRLAAFIAGYKCISLDIHKGFTHADFREQLKRILEQAGCENKPLVFLLTDAHLIDENRQLEDINSLINSGEVPNLFEAEEIETIIARVRPLAKAAGKTDGSRDSVLGHFVSLVRENLHIVLCFSPVGDAFRNRIRRYPSLLNCSTLDYFEAWNNDALHSVAERFLSAKELGLDAIRGEMCALCVRMHSSVADISTRFFTELRRYNYVTPTSYLELLKLFMSILLEGRESYTRRILKYRTGLNKLQSTNKLVEDLSADLVKLQPVLEASSIDVATLLEQLEKDQIEASSTAALCQSEAEECAVTTRQVLQIREECQADLDEAMPTYEAALKQLDTLDKNSITILKSFQHPPQPVKKCMEAVCILLGQKADWDSAKRLLNNTDFLKMCKNYDKDNVPRKTIKALQKYLQDPEFTSEALASVSEAAVGLCMWVRAMVLFAQVIKAVQPKREALAQAEASLRAAQETLAAKQLNLKVVEARVAALHAKYRQKQSEKDELEQNIERTKIRLVRAEKLVSGLSSEESRWQQQADKLHGDLKHLVGNMLLSAGSIAYLGPFTAPYRAELTAQWHKQCLASGIPVDSSYSLIRTLADPLVLRRWSLAGLPTDVQSQESALIATKGRRWPLIIDPQSQANRWLRTLGKRENIQIIKLSDANYLKVLENAIRYGQPVLLENVEERSSSGAPGLDPALEPLLQKQIFKKGGQWLLKLAENEIPFHDNFRFYITTKLANPHYYPEIFVKVTLVNMTVTKSGLEEQLLIALCALERADLELKNDRLTVQIADDKAELVAIEDKILELLSTSSGNILDDESLIQTLASSKTTSVKVTERMLDAESTVQTISATREQYRSVAQRASVLFFTIEEMIKVENMYEYSLQYFMQLYRSRIVDTRDDKASAAAAATAGADASSSSSAAAADLTPRLQLLIKDLTLSFYLNLCRGLFEKDKMLFSFLLAANITRASGGVSESEWAYFVRGPDAAAVKTTPPLPPHATWLAKQSWDELYHAPASSRINAIAGEIARDAAKSRAWHQWSLSFTPEKPSGAPLPASWQQALSPFQQLMLIKSLRRDRVSAGVKDFVTSALGARFTKPPPFDLKAAFAATTPRTPLIFILSPGANPMTYLTRLASERNKANPDDGLSRLKVLSLGQGQGPIAEEMMAAGRRDGDWVVLQNCHLSASFLPALDRILEATSGDEIHEDYRLILTTMPTDVFPVPILQNSVKVTQEAPKGVANNVMRTFLDLSEEEYEGAQHGRAWKKLLFGLAFFHAVMQERKRYGPIGFNIPYMFMQSDFEISKRQLKLYLDAAGSEHDLPWQTLTELIGEVNYAGRVTDDKDQRCVRSLLARYVTPQVLNDDYNFSDSGVYYAPKAGKLVAVREYIASLPDDTPEAFGLHDNADITFQLQETSQLLETLVAIQPRHVGGGGGSSAAAAALKKGAAGGDDDVPAAVEKTPDMIVTDICTSIEGRLPALLDRKQAHASTFKDLSTNNTLGVFLSQELDRFNSLLAVLRSTLVDLQKAIKGVVVMSADLEAMYNAMLYNQVPTQWAAAAYPSLKALGPWVDDLIERVAFIRDWLVNGPPNAYWLSAFFFQQGFLTAVLQRYARQTKIPIDTLKFATQVTRMQQPAEVTSTPAKGAYVYGLFLQGATFDRAAGSVVESAPGELFAPMPIVHLDPVTIDDAPVANMYECPVYKTSRRAGTLSTTGHSTNFVIFLRQCIRHIQERIRAQ